MPAYAELAYRVEFFGDEVERITEIDPLTGEVLRQAGRDRDLPGQALHHAAGEAHRGDRDHGGGAGGASSSCSTTRASCWRRSAWSSARATTWRCCARWATAPASRTTAARWRCGRPGSRPFTLLDYFPRRLPADHGRVAHDDAAGARHVQRRPGAQDGAGGLRLPPAVRAGQPAAEVRGVGGIAEPGDLHHRDARPLRAEHSAQVVEQIIRPDRPGGSPGGGPADQGADRRPAEGDPQAGGARASACWSPR